MQDINTEDLPADILDKLRNLDLELADGDITQKGYDKKRANLLASISGNTPTTPTTPTGPQQASSMTEGNNEEEILEDFGPEPSAADVVDFLDFLPSPTRSPQQSPRLSEGSTHMENNHLKLQQEYQHQQPPPQQQQPTYPGGSPSMRPMQPTPSYRPYRPAPPNNQPYFNNPAMGTPVPNNRPYMMVRNNVGYQSGMIPPQPQPQLPQQQQQQQRPVAPSYMYSNNRLPPAQNVYRPTNTTVYQRPMMYNINQRPTAPTQQPTRPLYRPVPPPPRPQYPNYRPQQPQQQYVPGRSPEMQYGNVRPNYVYGGPNRSPTSTSSMTGRYEYDQQHIYSTRNDSLEWNQ
ncbi:hypothetical protein BCV72DRAFT_60588 [Rhizopus microsporus var. microsporus]|uniref:DMAP1-binding domain-containing protein n=1 Tax=Rhizopus microsporus var. microsporus TaxID=86635 RepID=A0A1X0QQK4_RHIZD|nr:hypothetical protein BCV72DRAFT_60588 [Rhizopus microsporus var. microsporus]